MTERALLTVDLCEEAATDDQEDECLASAAQSSGHPDPPVVVTVPPLELDGEGDGDTLFHAVTACM